MSDERFFCPRREEIGAPHHLAPDGDTWATGHGLVGRQHVELSCSWCGSLHPDTFMDWVRRGAELDPTDKNYKVYIQCPDDDPRAGEVTEGVLEGGTRYTQVYGMECKFYFQHLTVEQRKEFVELLNAERLKFGASGGFYRLPFFITRGA